MFYKKNRKKDINHTKMFQQMLEKKYFLTQISERQVMLLQKLYCGDQGLSKIKE